GRRDGAHALGRQQTILGLVRSERKQIGISELGHGRSLLGTWPRNVFERKPMPVAAAAGAAADVALATMKQAGRTGADQACDCSRARLTTSVGGGSVAGVTSPAMREPEDRDLGLRASDADREHIAQLLGRA